MTYHYRQKALIFTYIEVVDRETKEIIERINVFGLNKTRCRWKEDEISDRVNSQIYFTRIQKYDKEKREGVIENEFTKPIFPVSEFINKLKEQKKLKNKEYQKSRRKIKVEKIIIDDIEEIRQIQEEERIQIESVVIPNKHTEKQIEILNKLNLKHLIKA